MPNLSIAQTAWVIAVAKGLKDGLIYEHAGFTIVKLDLGENHLPIYGTVWDGLHEVDLKHVSVTFEDAEVLSLHRFIMPMLQDERPNFYEINAKKIKEFAERASLKTDDGHRDRDSYARVGLGQGLYSE